MAKRRVQWQKPYRELDGQTPLEWLSKEYPKEPRNSVLARRLSGILDFEVSVGALTRRASNYRLLKSKDARKALNKYRGDLQRLPLRPPLIKFTEHTKIKADPVAITADWHIPYWNERKVRQLMILCQRWKPPVKRLIVAGDFLDIEQLSKFVKERDGDEGVERTLGDDLRLVEEMLTALSDWFKRIDVFMGNHEERLYSRKLEQEIGYDRLSRLWKPMGVISKRIRFSQYKHCELEGRGTKWRIGHPSRVWKNLNTLAQQLAMKYQTNYILAHSHKMSVGYDLSGNFIAIDSGGMCQPELMGYYMKEDNPNPVWCPGFVIISNGRPHLFNDIWTDWSSYEKWLDIKSWR